MVLQRFRHRREAFRQGQFPAFGFEDGAGQLDGGCIVAQSFCKHQTVVLVEGQQAGIEGSVEQGAQDDAVARVGTVFFRDSPRDDVAGHEQLRGGETTDGTTAIV